MFSQKMSKEALLIALKVDSVANKKALNSTMSSFVASHLGLVNGDKTMGLDSATTEACILQQMDVVYDVWTAFSDLLKAVVEDGQTDETVVEIAKMSPMLLEETNEAVTMYVTPPTGCTTTTTSLRRAGISSGATSWGSSLPLVWVVVMHTALALDMSSAK